jgi:GH43 family beta-xylosidase
VSRSHPFSRLATITTVVAALTVAALVPVPPSTAAPAQAITASAPDQFTNPISDVWDPSVVTDGGAYYLIGTSLDNKLTIRTSTTIGGLRDAPATVVWAGPTSGLGCCRLWSPVLTKVDGKWWIHLSVTNANATQSALYALEGTTTNPMGPYTYKATVKSWSTGDPYYWERAIVGPSVTVMPDGKLYLSTSTFGFYIQEMSNPWTLKPGSTMTTVSEGQPTLPWEGGTSEISRPFVKTVGGQTTVYVPYSSENHVSHRSSSGPCWSWCVGMFINTDGNLTNPASWTKAPQPVFTGGPSTGLYRVFALSTFKSPDQTEDWAIFNANDAPGTDFGERDTFAQKFTFDSSGNPVFGTPLAMGVPQDVPGGETGSPAAILPNSTLLNEPFSSSSGWSSLTGSWSLCSGQYCAGAGEAIAVAGENRWADYFVQAKVTATSQPNGSGINVIAHAQDVNNFYALELLRDGAGVEKWVLVKRIAGAYTILDSGPYNWDPNVPYWLRVSVNGDKIAGVVSTDGVIWTQLTEKTNYNLGFGRVGLRSWGGAEARFDDVLTIANRPSYGFYSGEGWTGLTIDAGANQPNPNEGYCENANNEYCHGGLTLSTTASISTAGVTNALGPAVYQTERWNDANPGTMTDDGGFRYSIPSLTPGAGYVVRLHFAELYWTAPGQRKFDVRLNGSLVLNEFDTTAAAGAARKAVVREFPAKADAFGNILLEFVPGQTAGADHNPTVSAIQVLPAAVRQNMGSSTGAGSFASDPLGTSGATLSTAATIATGGIAAAAPASVYKSERFAYGSPGDFHSVINGLAPGATYKVRLHFAEIHWSSAGQRAFNVAINGTSVLTNFDKVAAAGGANKAVVRTFAATANGAGAIDIRFFQGTIPGVDGNPTVSGIEVLTQ